MGAEVGAEARAEAGVGRETRSPEILSPLRRNGNGAEELGQNPELLLGNEDEITEAGILAKTAEAATVAAAAATAAKIMAVQWKRWTKTGAAWAVQVAGYTPRTGKRSLKLGPDDSRATAELA